MSYQNLQNAMQVLAACNECTATPQDFQQALDGVSATPADLAAMDAYVATLNQEQLENLVDGCFDEETDEGYRVLHAAPDALLLHELLDEMFMLICA